MVLSITIRDVAVSGKKEIAISGDFLKTKNPNLFPVVLTGINM